jgi:replicative DNA helicase
MTRKEVTVVGGRPGHGKTTLMINMVRCLIESGVKVMLFNREMSNVEMMKKIVVMESDNLAYRDVRRGNLNEEATNKFLETSERIKEKYKNLTMYDDIRTLDDAMIEISRNKPDVIFDDYIQLISMSDKIERRFQLERIMYEYKWICKEENCSAVLLSQLNRAIETRQDPRPRMSDFAESGVIEQTTELALFVWYPYNFDDTQFSPYEASLIAAKTRYGKIGQYMMGFNGNRCRYYETPQKAQENEAMKDTNKETWIHEGEF